jgi:hypothetical protein
MSWQQSISVVWRLEVFRDRPSVMFSAFPASLVIGIVQAETGEKLNILVNTVDRIIRRENHP